MTDLKELKGHIRWLEDELSAANNVDGDLENIDDTLTEIKDDLARLVETINRNTAEVGRLFDAYNTLAEVLKKLLVEVLTPKPPPAPSDMLGEFFPKAATNNPKERVAKPKPRKTKLSVVSKDGNEGPGGAP